MWSNFSLQASVNDKKLRNVLLNNASTLYSFNKKIINFKVHLKHNEIIQNIKVEMKVSLRWQIWR